MSAPIDRWLGLRVGDVVRDRFGHDDALLLGDYLGTDGTPRAWSALYFPTSPDLGEPFISFYPYDFAARDATAPGGLVAFADPWSTWTEEA